MTHLGNARIAESNATSQRRIRCLSPTSSGGEGGASFPLEEMADLSTKERARRFVLLSDTRRDSHWQKAHPDEFQTLIEWTRQALQVGADEPGRQSGARRQLEARALHDTFNRLPALKIPVYLCGGRYDGIAPLANLQALQRQIPGARLEFFEGGHLFFLQDPRALERISDFLKEEP